MAKLGSVTVTASWHFECQMQKPSANFSGCFACSATQPLHHYLSTTTKLAGRVQTCDDESRQERVELVARQTSSDIMCLAVHQSHMVECIPRV